jgi:serine/threonine-protein kinase
MGTTRWDQVAAIVSDALAVGPERRAALLAERCDGDTELAAEVASLLSASAADGGMLDREVAPRALEILAHGGVPGWEVGERIGPFLLLSHLGHGGMGTVFLAERRFDKARQQVALKRLDGLQGPDLTRRFGVEVQALLQLDHDGIARIFDFGQAAGGEPYLVLEYVGGTPVTRYCDDQRLTIAQRLELFLQICDAVRYAHGRLIVHCDIKPSNILVKEGGKPKLLDFGISRLLDPAVAEAESAAAASPLTPEYASPEQLAGGPLSVASDVYSLGVVLCELLCGSRPSNRTPASLPLDELAAAAAAPDGAVWEIAARRRATPRQLLRQLRGDLDSIVARALARDPAGRYRNADALVTDLQNHLQSRPVEARRGGFTYRASKAARRNLGFLVSAGLVTAILTTSTVVATVQKARIDEQARGLAEQGRQTARERDVAEGVTRFLVDLFEVSDPGEAKGAQVTARALLDRAAVAQDYQLRDQPEVRNRLRLTMAKVYENLGLFDQARRLLELARTDARRQHGDRSEQMTEVLAQLGNLARRQGRLAEAEAILRDTLHRVVAARAGDARVAKAFVELGQVVDDTEHLAEAEAMLRQAERLARRTRPLQPLLLSDALTSLARSHYQRARYAEAEPLMREALDLRRGADPTSPETAQALNNLGELLRVMGRTDEAAPLLTASVAMREWLLGPTHPDLAGSLNNLGQLHLVRGNAADAIAVLTRALKILGPLGEEHPTYGLTLNNLAAAEFNAGNLRRAEELFRQTLELRRRTMPASHPTIAQGLHNVAGTLVHQKRLGEAIPMYREALALRRQAFGEQHTAVATTLDSLATALAVGGDRAEAERLYRGALAHRLALLAAGHADVARTQRNLGWLLDSTGRSPAAEPLLRSALAGLTAALGSEHRDTALAANYLGACLRRLGREEEARQLLAGSAAGVRAGFPAGSLLRELAEANLASTLQKPPI